MAYYAVIYDPSYLAHHGIQGQKWGVQNGPPYPLARQKNKSKHKVVRTDDGLPSYLKGTRPHNFERWGKDEDHNILYVTGYSGSGKSTVAQKAGRNSETIHLDMYLEEMGDDTKQRYQNKAFNNYLDRRGIPFRKLNDGSLSGNAHRQERWNLIDRFAEASEGFGRDQYKKGRRVVMEGVQLADSTMYPDKSALKGKPVVVMKTGILKSTYRAAKRDDIKMYDIPTLAIRLNAQNKYWRKNLKNLNKSVNA